MRYELVLRSAYFEFIPVDEADEADQGAAVCDVSEVERGATYEVVMTTWGGLTRYRMGDVVKVVDLYVTAQEGAACCCQRFERS